MNICINEETVVLIQLTTTQQTTQTKTKEIRFVKVNRKVQGVSQSQAASNTWHLEEEKKDTKQRVQNKQTNAREAHRPALSSPKEVITVITGYQNKEQDKTQYETPRSKNHKATHKKKKKKRKRKKKKNEKKE